MFSPIRRERLFDLAQRVFAEVDVVSYKESRTAECAAFGGGFCVPPQGRAEHAINACNGLWARVAHKGAALPASQFPI